MKLVPCNQRVICLSGSHELEDTKALIRSTARSFLIMCLLSLNSYCGHNTRHCVCIVVVVIIMGVYNAQHHDQDKSHSLRRLAMINEQIVRYVQAQNVEQWRKKV